jgi:phage FluMu protein Com
MSIEFGCCECGKLLRVPESSAGKKARCPACGAIQDVANLPEAPISQPIVAPANRPEPRPISTTTAPHPESPFADTASSRNPFADGAVTESNNPFASSATNPYAAPASGVGMVSQGMFGPGSQAWARTSVEGPAKWLAAVGGVVIIFSAIGLAINLPGFIRNGVAEGAIFLIIGRSVMVIPYGIVIFGAIRMKQLKNYNLAIAASILAMLPCSACCILGLPVGIWSLVVLCNRDIRAAFQQAA